MTDNVDISEKVEEVARKHEIEVKAVRRFGNSLQVETDHHTNEMSYLAALWFYELAEYDLDTIVIRQSITGDIEEYDLYEVLGTLIAEINDSEISP